MGRKKEINYLEMERNPTPIWKYISLMVVAGLGVFGYHQIFENLDGEKEREKRIKNTIEEKINFSEEFDNLKEDYDISELNYGVENGK